MSSKAKIAVFILINIGTFFSNQASFAKDLFKHPKFNIPQPEAIVTLQRNLLFELSNIDAIVDRVNILVSLMHEHTKPRSVYDYFIGKPRKETFGSFDAVRVLVVIPSEYARDSASDWDSFEMLIGAMAPLSATSSDEGAKNIWISTENYRYRQKQLLSGLKPSPDWEYAAPTDNDISNARLRNIAERLKFMADNYKRAGEDKSEYLRAAPAVVPGVKAK